MNPKALLLLLFAIFATLTSAAVKMSECEFKCKKESGNCRSQCFESDNNSVECIKACEAATKKCIQACPV